MKETFPDPFPLLIGHGSRHIATARAGQDLADQVAQVMNKPVGLAWLDYCSPSIKEVLDHLAQNGVTNLAVQPLMLSAAGHVNKDIPEALANFKGVVKTGPPLGSGPDGTGTLLDSIVFPYALKAIDAFTKHPQVMIIARDSHGPAFQHAAKAFAARLESVLGLTPTIGYVGATDKPWKDVLDGLPDDDLVVLPLLLLRGRLWDQIEAAVNERAATGLIMPPLSHNNMLALKIAEQLHAVTREFPDLS